MIKKSLLEIINTWLNQNHNPWIAQEKLADAIIKNQIWEAWLNKKGN